MTLISGTVASQAILFLLSPVLSRVFDPSAFGELANYNAWVSVLGLFSNLRYEQALIVASGRFAMNRVIALALCLSAVSFIAFGLLAFAANSFAMRNGYLHEIRGILPLIPIGMVPTVIVSLLTQFNTRKGRFKLIAAISVIQVVATLAIQLGLGFARIPQALVYGVLGGSVIACLLFVVAYLRRNPPHHVTREMRWPSLLATASEHANFPRYSLAADVVGSIVQQFVPVVLTGMFGPAAAGLYSFATRAIRAPFLVISTSVTTVLRKQAGDEIRRSGSIGTLFRRVIGGLSFLAVGPFLVLGVFAQPMFSTVFGSKWQAAGQVAQILSPGMALEFVAFPLLVFFVVTNHQRYSLRVQLTNAVGLLIALFLGRMHWHSFTATCVLMSAFMVATNTLTAILAYRVAHSHAVEAPVIKGFA